LYPFPVILGLDPRIPEDVDALWIAVLGLDPRTRPAMTGRRDG
jgi:hypothetical protein